MSNDIDDSTHHFLESNLKGLLQEMLEWMESRNVALRSGTEIEATPAEARLFAALRGRERSLSELARVLGVSRQAVHHTAHRLVAHGVVELIPAPDSGREKRIRVTRRGELVRELAADNLREIERQIAVTIGRENLELMRGLLQQHLSAARTENG